MNAPRSSRPAVRRSFLVGLTTLLRRHSEWLSGRRVGLVTHPAAVDEAGAPALDLLRASGVRLTALFGPEHGFFGNAPAGEPVPARRHPRLRMPVHSLYGGTRRPTPRMLRDLDVLVVDLQDLGTRCYTYVATLRYVLEAAARCEKTVVVADRPVPLPRVADGPLLDPALESFVAPAPLPLSYGMTPGETALWLRRELTLPVDLRVAPMQGYRREGARRPGWPPWIPPSPGIASWESAQCYAATVFTEAFPSLAHGRRSGLPFQILAAPWLRGAAACERLADLRLSGVRFHAHPCWLAADSGRARLVEGVRLTVTDPARFRPVATSLWLLHALAALCGRQRLWSRHCARPAFFDALYGTAAVRAALLDGESPAAIAARWARQAAPFRQSRRAALLYHPG